MGLRELKKAATHQAIERAALEIACEQGYEAASAEAVAARANVSLRTFFNYFPNKDLALVGKILSLISEEDAHQILRESQGDLLYGIARVSEASLCSPQLDPDLMAERCRLIMCNPSLFYLHMTEVSRLELWLTRIVADYLQANASERKLVHRLSVEEEALLAVTVVSTAVRYQLQRAAQTGTGVVLSAGDIKAVIAMISEMRGKAPRSST
jgi:AcrR family transcriptional regulator